MPENYRTETGHGGDRYDPDISIHRLIAQIVEHERRLGDVEREHGNLLEELARRLDRLDQLEREGRPT
jgi:hypothetical protein